MALKNNAQERDDTTFASVLADGKIHVAVPDGTEGAVVREYETSDGKAGKKTELIYTEVSGLIQKVGLKEGEYGINIFVVIGDEEDEKPVTLSLSTESNYGEDLLKKLPNINLKKVVTIAPYSFENDKGKKQRGLSITQEGKKDEKVKILNFYYDIEDKTVANGYPKPLTASKGKVISKSQWRKYFSDAREFLIADVSKRLDITTEEGEATKVYNAM